MIAIGPANAVSPLGRSNPFVDPVAVEAWDAWFRWRRGDRLLDATVDATWHRVASALALAEPRNAATWAARLGDAFAAWQLLPDPQLLAAAGTGSIEWNSDGLVAVLNPAGFVRAPFTEHAHFDRVQFERVAELAVRMLDDAVLLSGCGGAAPTSMRIGLIGMADALALLGLSYDSGAARAFAAETAQALAQGCLTGSIVLAGERGAAGGSATACAIEMARARGVAPGLIVSLGRHGTRCARLTAVTSQPHLALFANNVADALAPLTGADHALAIEAPEGVRRFRSSGYALTLRQRRVGAADRRAQVDTLTQVPVAAQAALRAAVQPWIDAPIDVPLRRAHDPAQPSAQATDVGSKIICS